MAKITITVDLDDLEISPDEDSSYVLSDVIKDAIMGEIRQELRTIAKKQVDTIFGENAKKLVIQELQSYLTFNFKQIAENIKVTGSYGSTPVTIIQYLDSYFNSWENNVDKKLEEIHRSNLRGIEKQLEDKAKLAVDNLRKIYDISFAT